MRRAKCDYAVPNTDHIIEKDTPVWVSVYGIHHDPKYYPQPDVFDPDRFAPEKIAQRDSSLWLPFGEGPRNCIGIRFGMMQVRVGLIALLNHFEFQSSDRTKIPLEFENYGLTLSAKDGLWLKLKRITRK